jgi:hypothetical protein
LLKTVRSINITGLQNLVSVGDDFYITRNDALTGLTGLDNLYSLGGDFFIIDENSSLPDLTGLSGLTSIGNNIYIENNSSLVSLMGIENIEPGSIGFLKISGNNLLSECDVKSVCDYLASTGAVSEIENNSTGCNNADEVKEACPNAIEEIKTGNGIVIIPNPSNDKITISSHAITGNTKLSIFNVSGEKVIERQLMDTDTQIDISALPRGVYFVRLQNEKMVEVGKMVKE